MQFGDLRPVLDFIITQNKKIEYNTSHSENKPTGLLSGVDAVHVVAAGYSKLVVTKTNSSGTVVVTFPDTSTYTLTATGEVFTIEGHFLGAYTITGAGGAIYKYYAF